MTEKNRVLHGLYTVHEPAVRGFLVRLAGPGLDVESLVHEVFLIAWRKLDSMREPPGRGWFFATAVRVLAGVRRRERIRRFVGLDAVPEPVAPTTPASS